MRMPFKKKIERTALLVCAAVFIAGWGTCQAAGGLKVGLVTDVGKIDDKTFNEAAYKGMKRAAVEFGLKTSFIETLQPTDYEKNIQRFVSEKYEMIITVGFMLGDATRKMAEKHPDVKFAIVDFAFDPPLENVAGLVFAEGQAGFLAGALAGYMTETKIVGMVAGMEIPPVIRFRKGFDAGVKHACSGCEVLTVHIDSFTDPARGKTAALSQIDEGADVIFGGGGTTGSGAIQGAARAGAWVIGVDQDEYLTTFKQGKMPGANRVLSSAMKRVDNAVYNAVKGAATGSFKGGTALFDIASGGIGLAPYHEADSSVKKGIREKLGRITEDLKSGTIKPIMK